VSWADLDTLRAWAAYYGVSVPADDDAATRLLELATGDVRAYIGADWDLAVLDPEQVQALASATCAQACLRAAQGGDAMLGADDGVSVIGPLTLSRQPPVRLSPEVPILLAGTGLYARSGTVATPDE
jgi:hypothetical protein